MLESKRVWWVVLLGALYLAPFYAHSQSTGLNKFSALAPERATPFKFDGEYSFDLGGGRMVEGKDDVAAGYVYFNSELNFHFLSNFRAKISPAGRFYSGRSQERYDSDDLESRIYLHDAYLSFEPWTFLDLRVGAHAQSVLATSMLVSGMRSFPGLQERVKADLNRTWTGALVFQQVVPTSHSVNLERAEAEPLPKFITSHAEVKGTVPGWLELEARAGLYQWSQMPSKVVYESRLVGNVGFGDVVPGSTFKYDHKGWFGGGAACLCTDFPIDVVVEYSRIHNTAAPSNAADAQLWGIGPKIKWPGYELDVRYRSYFIESEATVATYAKSRLGNTNRIGNNIEASLKFKDYGFSLYAEMYRNQPLNVDPYQRDMNMYFFGVETEYVSF